MIFPEAHNLKIVITLTIGFSLASFLGYFSQKIKFSPILGYLLAGYIIGPFFPGYVADLALAEQLAEVGVMLMMFGVGLHFKWQDLVAVKNIAIPGAIGQTGLSALITVFLIHAWGWSWEAGIVIGISVGVASTVVLVRVLSTYGLLNTTQGHITIGWLIVEDLLTVIALILLPTLLSEGKVFSFYHIPLAIAEIIIKFILLALLMFTWGRKIASYFLLKTAHTRSYELFTVTVLAIIFFIATSSSLIFGTSIALGAFIAGMVIGQTELRNQALIHSSSMKDAFAVLFFISVGMLFNPTTLMQHFPLFLLLLSVILIVKPLIAFMIASFLKYSSDTALIIGLALAQIGEFSFIVAEEANRFDILPDEAFDLLVACALISIAINPLFFRVLDYLHLLPPPQQKSEARVHS